MDLRQCVVLTCYWQCTVQFEVLSYDVSPPRAWGAFITHFQAVSSALEVIMQGDGSTTWELKEFGVMHEEVSSSFMKQAQQYSALHHKVSNSKEEFERLCRENGERELCIRDRETELAHEDDLVKRLRTEHASLEENNKRMRDEEEQLEETRKEEHRKYIETLHKCTRQMYASRQASNEASKSPELARMPGKNCQPGPPTVEPPVAAA